MTEFAPARAHTVLSSSILRRFAALALGLFFAAAVLAGSPLAGASADPIGQCNDVAGVSGGTGAVECTVTVTNNRDLSSGVVSSSVSTIECIHEANTVVDCGPATVVNADHLVTAVDQCNGSINVGGGNVLCTVNVVNNVTGTPAATVTAATVNQCIESGTGGGTAPTMVCDPLGETTNATVTQCNGSGNGGGGPIRVQCTVDTPSTVTADLPVTVNQCNGSGNGGGSTVICATSMTTTINGVLAALPVVSTPTPTPTAAPVVPVAAGPELARTGFDSAPLSLWAATMILVGGLVISFSALRKIRRRERRDAIRVR
ncbi:MAG TPA: hypothetical protein VFC59_02765 [Cryobacterium sp.]|nr:hypothetical protein [Cryobacterium sp.]